VINYGKLRYYRVFRSRSKKESESKKGCFRGFWGVFRGIRAIPLKGPKKA